MYVDWSQLISYHPPKSSNTLKTVYYKERGYYRVFPLLVSSETFAFHKLFREISRFFEKMNFKKESENFAVFRISHFFLRMWSVTTPNTLALNFTSLTLLFFSPRHVHFKTLKHLNRDYCTMYVLCISYT